MISIKTGLFEKSVEKRERKDTFGIRFGCKMYYNSFWFVFFFLIMCFRKLKKKYMLGIFLYVKWLNVTDLYTIASNKHSLCLIQQLHVCNIYINVMHLRLLRTGKHFLTKIVCCILSLKEEVFLWFIHKWLSNLCV